MLPNNGRSISRIVAKNVPCFTKPVIRSLIALVPESEKNRKQLRNCKNQTVFQKRTSTFTVD